LLKKPDAAAPDAKYNGSYEGAVETFDVNVSTNSLDEVRIKCIAIVVFNVVLLRMVTRI